MTAGASSATARRLADAAGERTEVVTELLEGRRWRRPAPRRPGNSRARAATRAASAATRARSRRRTRFLTTAPPTGRPTAYATPGGVAAASCTQEHQTTPCRKRRPSDRKRSNTARSRIRPVRPTAAAGPSPGVTSGWRAQHECSSGGGNHGASSAGGCWAGRCASPCLLDRVRATPGGEGAHKNVQRGAATELARPLAGQGYRPVTDQQGGVRTGRPQRGTPAHGLARSVRTTERHPKPLPTPAADGATVLDSQRSMGARLGHSAYALSTTCGCRCGRHLRTGVGTAGERARTPVDGGGAAPEGPGFRSGLALDVPGGPGLELHDSDLTLSVPSSQVRDRIEGRYLPLAATPWSSSAVPSRRHPRRAARRPL